MTAAVAQSLSSLLQRTTIEDHEAVLKSCNAVLAKSKSDTRAQHVKAVALLKLDRYEDCLRVFEDAGDALKQSAGLEYAYALYKCGKPEDAITIVSQLGAGRGAQHLEAQAAYRAERFHRTAEIYEDLREEHVSMSNEENDLRINSWAADAQLQWKGQSDSVHHTKATRDDLEAFETAFNAACLSLAKGEFGQAEILLTRAKELCRTSEDLTAEDKEAELVPILVQQLYVLNKQGKQAEAQALLEEISISNISDLSTKKITQNNVILTQQTSPNPYVLYKALNASPTPVDNDKLFEFQNNILVGNTHTADLLVRKYDGIIRSTSKALSQSPCPSVSPSVNLLAVYNAAAHAQGQTGALALKAICPLLERRPKDLGLALTAVQLYASTGNTTAAIHTLEAFLRGLEESISEDDKDARFNPGLLSVLVSLYKREGRTAHIRSELAKAAAHWRDRSEPCISLLQAAGTSLLHSSDRADLEMAGTLFRSLHQRQADDLFATAGYVASQAVINYASIENQVDQLPSVSDLVADVDVDALEQTGILPSPGSVAAAAAVIAGARGKRPAAPGDEKSAKRVRKSRLPKEYDPAKTPDPERWLPLRDRSTYRPKGRKGKQRAADRMQGGVVSEKVEEVATTVKSSGGGGGGGQKKKKKGKR
ncbi:hypothetical protein ASPZODRAFT_72804 [Penicilliopsis zonata CBS 506.65]|uniref:Signal recognition particle subunit SRP72 n=1 Tax=Penicilliopsis zonata CBS 506.65 TaxID=1073090 RepID=A0A1L9SA81_9EURO|nr:hypothetical protein ASPZODRAFT_72804 [Penicilliopsis zonata CBS 506.65]OJJ44090.1 hypothetical protein ASPZODRAFT_72804 [Penicilliopsis zonata CBS 506.65]